jgi:RNA polymerase sigma factor for flagellar operon FliA
MQHPLVSDSQRHRIEASVPFVEGLARRMAASMPHSIDVGDLVQSGMVGLIDAAHRFDESRGIKFETFAERRVRGAIIDALRRDSWPRGVRRMRRQLEAAREELRRELGHEPSLADLAARVGADETRLGRTIVRINTIESTSPLAAIDETAGVDLPPVLVPAEPLSPERAYEVLEVRERIRAAVASLPPRERRVIGRYYFDEATMKQIGAEIGVNESRVSQLHARAVQRLKRALAADAAHAPADIVSLVALRDRLGRGRAVPAASCAGAAGEARTASVLPYPATSRATRTRSASLNGFGSQRQPEVSRNRPASVPATSPVTKITRRAAAGALAAIAR